MNVKEFWLIIICAFLLLPIAVIADNDSFEVSIPSFTINYSKDYADSYTCKYRLNISEEVKSGYVGTFDFTVNFSKKDGSALNTLVTQVSEFSDITDLDISKLETKNSISKTSHYINVSGYSCPSLMAFYSEKEDETTGKYIGGFELKIFEQNEYDKTANDKVAVGRWYKKLHNYNITKYDCNIYKDETSCNGDKYCGWKLTDSHHKTYACLEKEYSSIVIGDEEQSTIRTENCSGYTEPIFNQTIEYSFSSDGTFNVASGGGNFSFVGSGNLPFKDKDNLLWNLWKQGECCSLQKLGMSYTESAIILSCDGSKSDWQYSGEGLGWNIKKFTALDNASKDIWENCIDIEEEKKNVKKCRKKISAFYNDNIAMKNFCNTQYADLKKNCTYQKKKMDTDKMRLKFDPDVEFCIVENYDYTQCDDECCLCEIYNKKQECYANQGYFGNHVISKSSGTDCTGVLGSLGDVLSEIYNILKLAVPVIIVAMGFKDFIQGMSSGKDDALKKAGTNFIKRLVVGAVFVMLPILIKMILTFAFGGSFSDICIKL